MPVSIRSVIKHSIPEPLRHLGWRGYYSVRDNYLKTIVGCQTNQKIVALTFDDGPHPEYTPAILDVLAHYQVKATFFLLGRNVAAHPEIASAVVQAGHAVGNHTFTHPYLAGCSPSHVARELLQCQRIIKETTGAPPKVMRPPFGAQSDKSYLTARAMGYPIVNWSASGDDWQGDPAPILAQRILSDVQPGGIILLHDGWELPFHETEWKPEYDLFQDRSPTIRALSLIIEPLHSQGYRFVTVPELLRQGRWMKQTWFV